MASKRGLLLITALGLSVSALSGSGMWPANGTPAGASADSTPGAPSQVLTGAGVVTNFTSSSVNQPVGIAAGPAALWFTSNGNNSIGRISTTGSITSYTDPSVSGPTAITRGGDGALWFTNNGNTSTGRITTNGAITHYPAFGNDITRGPTAARYG
jgi:streptogramin lyase